MSKANSTAKAFSSVELKTDGDWLLCPTCGDACVRIWQVRVVGWPRLKDGDAITVLGADEICFDLVCSVGCVNSVSIYHQDRSGSCDGTMLVGARIDEDAKR